MTRTKRFMTPLALALACTGAMALPAGADIRYEQIKIDAGAALFDAECRRCHAVDVEHASYGPPLENIVGRTAGSWPDFDYSDALVASGIVWTPAALRAWMEDNDGFMPGTKMRHVGIEDRTVQDFILAYLDSLSVETSN